MHHKGTGACTTTTHLRPFGATAFAKKGGVSSAEDDMPPSPSWRDRFIDLAAELRHARGETAPTQHADTGQALRLSLRVDGIDFEAVHQAPEGPQCPWFLLRCRFGPIPDTHTEASLRQALEMNFDLARLQVGGFGLDADSNELVFSSPQALQGADGALLLQGLSGIAALATQWRRAQHPSMA